VKQRVRDVSETYGMNQEVDLKGKVLHIEENS